MGYKCPLCGQVVNKDVKGYIEHTEDHIVDIIKKKHPEWVREDGICHKCIEYYKNEIKGKR